MWTSGAQYSDIGEIIARTDPDLPKHKGLTGFIVDMRAPGVEIRPLRQMTGGASFNEVFFTDVRVPDSHRLGDVNNGWNVALTTLMNERAAIGAGGGGLGGGLLHRAIEMARAFGLTSDPLVRQKLADLVVHARVMQYTNQRAMDKIRAGQLPGPEMSIAKLASTQQTGRLTRCRRRAARPEDHRRHRRVGHLRLVAAAARLARRAHRRRQRRGDAQHRRRAGARAAEGSGHRLDQPVPRPQGRYAVEVTSGRTPYREPMASSKRPPSPEPDASVTHRRVPRQRYEAELLRLQAELVTLQEWVRAEGQRLVVIFEGRDAAGKGGSIKRVTEYLNARVARVVALPAPTERERTQWYFQRYIAHLPAAGEIVLLDRSWYNRAGVERVMGFCTDAEYHRFLHQCPTFERMLVEDGIILRKYWFSVSDAEQEARFHARMDDPMRFWKLSPMDLGSITHWEDYSRAKDNMTVHTSIPEAPWYIVESDDKRAARLNMINHLLTSIDYVDVGRPEARAAQAPEVDRVRATATRPRALRPGPRGDAHGLTRARVSAARGRRRHGGAHDPPPLPPPRHPRRRRLRRHRRRARRSRPRRAPSVRPT